MASKEVDRQLLLTYLEGNCSHDQLRRIREYLRDEAYRDSLNRFMQEEWETLNHSELPPLPGMEDQYARFRSCLPREKPRKRITLRLYPMAAVAAALLLLVAGIWLLRPLLPGRQHQDMAAQGMYFHNEPGHRREILLPDSTHIYLGSASSLRYKQEDNGNRLALLQGEAYFVVKHDQHRPFTVVTGSLTTVDIGTEFNVRYYPGEPSIEVAVARGKVQVLHTGRPADTPLAALVPGQRLQYDTLTRRSGITTLPDAELAGAWRKGILSFSRQRLKEVTDELQRYYGVRFQYTNPADEHILITTLLDNKSLEDALDIVTLTAGIHFTRQGNLIVLK